MLDVLQLRLGRESGRLNVYHMVLPTPPGQKKKAPVPSSGSAWSRVAIGGAFGTPGCLGLVRALPFVEQGPTATSTRLPFTRLLQLAKRRKFIARLHLRQVRKRPCPQERR
jgi:hypothetical protein